ncbi:hypothetical protein LTR70_003133 [Exophiala xenobiotica]|uniref:Early meiotic induction protein 1 n=1 Tax=Lithohypha guttulata TaxID=1690604 RepID=A0ABR0KH50_9EURO|nr:hypothetical protein LTR24_002635 [Lithohypha guttulata]KAK5323844.1 hypothetical protein LTR70_003133 [Exophiala xenobiotica]
MWWPFGSPSNNANTDRISSVEERELAAAQPPPPARLPTPIKQELSREEQANIDFAELLKEIEIEQAKSQEQRVGAKKDGKSQSTPVPADISPEALYPADMSCRSALDYAMFCQSFGGQFVNIYRYGEFRSCKNHWADFWLCMRTKNWDEKDKAQAIQDHYRKKAVQWKTGPSSEDIWDVRQEPVRDAFQESLEDLEAKIAEWKQANPDVPDPWDKRQGTTFNNPPPSA